MNGDRLNTAQVIVTHYAAEYAAVFPEPLPSEADLAAATCFSKNAVDGGLTDGAVKSAVTQVHVNAAKAIAAYEWLLSSDRSPFDLFATEGPASTQLSPAEQRGLRIFVGRGSCYDCHRTPLFSDGKFHDVGVPQAGESVPTLADCVPSSPSQPAAGCAAAPACDCTNLADEKTAAKCLPLGASTGRKKLDAALMSTMTAFSRASAFSGDPTSGFDLSLFPARSDAWRTPSLRDVALTAPYMHDGLYDTLADVVWHYDQGGAPSGDPHRGCDPDSGESCTEIAPLGLSDEDREDLVAFLGSLTGQPRPYALTRRPPGGVPGLPAEFPVSCPKPGTTP
jgi:cytochrome c peroxidase